MSLLPQFGFIEFFVLAVVALIVIGPRDMPKLMRQAGQAVARLRGMAHEFTSAFDQMARDAEMEELRQEMQELRKANPVTAIKDEVDLSMNAMKKTADEAQDALNDTPENKPQGQVKASGDAKAENTAESPAESAAETAPDKTLAGPKPSTGAAEKTA